jgi:hypothetical protein
MLSTVVSQYAGHGGEEDEPRVLLRGGEDDQTEVLPPRPPASRDLPELVLRRKAYWTGQQRLWHGQRC